MKDADHVLVVGPSGGGKSTYAGEMFARHDGPAAYLSTDDGLDPTPYDPPRRTARPGATYPDDIERVRSWARANGDVTLVVVDECQNAPSFREGDGPLADGLHQDRSDGVVWVVATQNPMDLRTRERGYGPVQQARYWVWCGPVKDWHTGFLNANGMSDMTPHMPTSNYEYVVLDPTASLPTLSDRIVARGETDPRWSP
jgi:hypothetical protein